MAVGTLRLGGRRVSACRGGRDGTADGANGAVMCYNLRTVLTKQVRRVANGKTASSDGESEGASAEASV